MCNKCRQAEYWERKKSNSKSSGKKHTPIKQHTNSAKKLKDLENIIASWVGDPEKMKNLLQAYCDFHKSKSSDSNKEIFQEIEESFCSLLHNLPQMSPFRKILLKSIMENISKKDLMQENNNKSIFNVKVLFFS